MVEVRDVHADAYGSSGDANGCRLQHMPPAASLCIFPREALHNEGDDHQGDDEQIVVGHLHVVGVHLEGCEECRNDKSPKVFPSIGKHHAGNHRWQIGQRPHLPDVSSGNDDEEITGERPHDATQHGQLTTEVEGAHQDVEAQQVDKHVPHIVGQPQMIGVDDLRQKIGTLIRGRCLIGRHTAEDGIRPACALTCLLQILQRLLPGAASCRRVVLVQNTPLQIGGHEIGECDDRKQQYHQQIWQILLQFLHKIL